MQNFVGHMSLSTSSAQENPLPCGDWLLSTGSNVSVAKDRSWFTDNYTQIRSNVQTILGGPPIEVIGIGSVRVPVRRCLRASGANAHSTLVLNHVLHVPGMMCNVISGGTLTRDGYCFDLGETGKICLRSSPERNVAVLVHANGKYEGLPALKLSGFPVGPRVAPTPRAQSAFVIVSVIWPDDERVKAVKQLEGVQADHEPPLNDAEKQFLKDNFRNEFTLLRQFGLNIHKDEHREEGRAIVRRLMAQEEEEDSDDGHHIVFDNDDDDEAEHEVDPYDFERHLADHHFTAEQLDFIERGYGSSMAFMHSIGLKFYSEEDCQEAKAIVESLMTDDV